MLNCPSCGAESAEMIECDACKAIGCVKCVTKYNKQWVCGECRNKPYYSESAPESGLAALFG